MANAASAKPTSDGSQLTYNETVDVICGFSKHFSRSVITKEADEASFLRSVKTAIHTILCHRQVYPSNVFTRRQRYRVPVWASRHPGLTAYIDEVIAATKVQIEKAALRSVHVVLTSVANGSVLERYRFDIDILLNNLQPRDRNLSIPGNMTMEGIELQLRAFMMKLISLDGALSDLENAEDLSWALVLDMKDGLDPQTDDKSGNEPAQGQWVPFEESEESTKAKESEISSELRARSRERKKEEANETDGPFILPVKSLDTGVINLMLFVEENPKAKRASQEAKSGSLSSQSRSQTRKSRLQQTPLAESIRLGERDIDAPLPQPSSSGAIASRVRKGKKKAKAATVEDEDASSDSDSISGGSSGSGDSLQSVNDFAGYGKGAGSVGMSGVGM